MGRLGGIVSVAGRDWVEKEDDHSDFLRGLQACRLWDKVKDDNHRANGVRLVCG